MERLLFCFKLIERKVGFQLLNFFESDASLQRNLSVLDTVPKLYCLEVFVQSHDPDRLLLVDLALPVLSDADEDPVLECRLSRHVLLILPLFQVTFVL